MMAFQRARSEENREIRRQAILDTATQMLGQMSVNDISLNELSRRSLLAKSAILRYFESREAVLLELLDRAWTRWTAELADQLPTGDPAEKPVRQRCDELASTLTRSLGLRPELCDLLSAQAGVLEHNVSPEVARRYKKAAVTNVAALADLTHAQLPELGETTGTLCGQIIMAAGAVWVSCLPSASMLAAYEIDPELAKFRLPFESTLHTMLTTLITGSLALAPSEGDVD
ncbi:MULTISPECIES: TetR/AcrR family transcriptional regulator [Actinoalloteichus]|nr:MULTISPECIES: TetR family transcriptional regulator [Actinoalloteichus]